MVSRRFSTSALELHGNAGLHQNAYICGRSRTCSFLTNFFDGFHVHVRHHAIYVGYRNQRRFSLRRSLLYYQSIHGTRRRRLHRNDPFHSILCERSQHDHWSQWIYHKIHWNRLIRQVLEHQDIRSFLYHFLTNQYLLRKQVSR